ncbi:hypothetical protein GCK32_001412, partial [Trichostrongylus colubriformis]
KCIPLLQARGLRNEVADSSRNPDRDIRDNRSENANKSENMVIRNKMNDDGRVIDEVAERAGDQVEQLREKVEQQDDERKRVL